MISSTKEKDDLFLTSILEHSWDDIGGEETMSICSEFLTKKTITGKISKVGSKTISFSTDMGFIHTPITEVSQSEITIKLGTNVSMEYISGKLTAPCVLKIIENKDHWKSVNKRQNRFNQ